MKEFFRVYFSFSRSQQRGVLFLSFLIILFIFLNIFYDNLTRRGLSNQKDYSELVQTFLTEDSLENVMESPKYKFKDFDPNTVSAQTLISMGLTEKQAMNIINYRNKVGEFTKVSELKKLYTIDEKLYGQMVNYIVIQSKRENDISQAQDKVSKEIKNSIEDFVPVEINSADTTDLIKIKGIGSYFANRIVKFRDALGGFHSLEQLYEVYGLKDYPETIESIKEDLTLDVELCNKIEINNVSAESLSKHPYFSSKLSRVLVNYRDQHGPFETIEDVKKCRLVTEDIYANIAPYLSIN